MFSPSTQNRGMLQLPPHRTPPGCLSRTSQRMLPQLRWKAHADRAPNLPTQGHRLWGQASYWEHTMQVPVRPPTTTHYPASCRTPVREQTPAPRKSSRSASSARSASRDRSYRPRQLLTWADRVRRLPPVSNQKIPDHNEGELRALREELSRLTALTCLSYSFSLNFTSYPNTNQYRSPSVTILKQRMTPPPRASGPIDVHAKLKELSDQFDKKLKDLEIRLESFHPGGVIQLFEHIDGTLGGRHVGFTKPKLS
ncbi:hypothetical protein HPB49_021283 [Dermacentor silvarum]|uniref:Uncharacterized protein n=1 Tax=Dermacentor silvarum TaxID=543639 RepID=A0ACB8E380_DERSI|nr:hypothetical protein HPB49_021283 [Dermacentor silvarum]